MCIQRNVSQKRICLVVLLTVFLLLAGGCGGPQSSPKAIIKAYLDDINSLRCGSIAALMIPASSGWSQDDTYIEMEVARCDGNSTQINTAYLDVQENLWIRETASPAEKVNGFGDRLSVPIRFAERQRDCSDCRWEDHNCKLDLRQYKSKWWILSSNCQIGTPSPCGSCNGGM